MKFLAFMLALFWAGFVDSGCSVRALGPQRFDNAAGAGRLGNRAGRCIFASIAYIWMAAAHVQVSLVSGGFVTGLMVSNLHHIGAPQCGQAEMCVQMPSVSAIGDYHNPARVRCQGLTVLVPHKSADRKEAVNG